ncbi:hypothetical protein EV363DRAFT_832851 [Boletus edulis]|nr:hypothetical protein EV363DRAFT_832851 [Boletus edulis]
MYVVLVRQSLHVLLKADRWRYLKSATETNIMNSCRFMPFAVCSRRHQVNVLQPWPAGTLSKKPTLTFFFPLILAVTAATIVIAPPSPNSCQVTEKTPTMPHAMAPLGSLHSPSSSLSCQGVAIHYYRRDSTRPPNITRQLSNVVSGLSFSSSNNGVEWTQNVVTCESLT